MAIFANFWSFFAIFTLFGAFSLCTVGAFLAIFPIFLELVGIFWGTPANYFADFGAILTIFNHFGPFFFLPFLTENPENPQKQRCMAVWRYGTLFIIAPAGGGGATHCHTSRRKREKRPFFAEGECFCGAFCEGNDLFREVVVEKIDFYPTFFGYFLAICADFWPLFAIFTLLGAFSLCTVRAFLAIF